MYRRMLVPKWMNIAVMGAESAKAEEQRRLLDMAEKIEDGEEIEEIEDDTTMRAAKADFDASRKNLDDAREAKRSVLESIKTTKERAKRDTKARAKGDNLDSDIEQTFAGKLSDSEKLIENAKHELKASRMKLQRTRDDLKKNHPAMKYYDERNDAYDNASKKAGRVEKSVENLEKKRKKLTEAEAEKQPNAEDLKKQVNKSEKAVANALEESRIADEKDRYRNAAVRDLEQKEKYDQASRNADRAFEAAKSAYKAEEAKDSATKPTNGSASNPPNGSASNPPNGSTSNPPNGSASNPPNGSTSNPPNGSAPEQNKSDKSDDASAQTPTNLKDAMTKAETVAHEAKAKTEPSFMRKTLTGIAEWWTGQSGKSSENADSGTKMGMAHFV
jgi:hypothetical protein